MPIIKKLVYLIMLLLFLEVVKTVLDKLNFSWSYLGSSILASIQYLLVIAFVLYTLCWWLWPLFRKGNKSLLFWSLFILLTGICESVFAWWLHHPERMPRFLNKAFEYYYYHYDLDIVQYHASLSTYNSRLFYTLKPGVTGKFQNKEFNTTISSNSFGLRDDEASLHQPAVICLGDSYAMGWGVEQRETFAQQLEQISALKVLNGGISSYGTAREMILLNELDTTALSFLIIQYSSNDYNENIAYLANNNRLAISSRGAYDSLVSRQHYIGYYYPGKYFSLISQVFIKQQINKLVPVFKLDASGGTPLNEKEHARAFAEVLSHAPVDFSKVRVLVMAVGDSPGFGPEFIQHLKGLFRQPVFQNNVLAIETQQVIEPDDWFIMDRHLKPSGHRKLAKMINDIIGGR